MPVSGGSFRQKFQMMKGEREEKKPEKSKAPINSECCSERDK